MQAQQAKPRDNKGRYTRVASMQMAPSTNTRPRRKTRRRGWRTAGATLAGALALFVVLALLPSNEGAGTTSAPMQDPITSSICTGATKSVCANVVQEQKNAEAMRAAFAQILQRSHP